MRGKNTCKILKEIRRQIALENDIELVISECTYQGDCLGTCPKCEAEVRYLEHELAKRQALGKAAMVAGLSLGTMLSVTSCDSTKRTAKEQQPLAGDVEKVEKPDTIREPLMGIVPMYHNVYKFDTQQYQSLLKDKFVPCDIAGLEIVEGEVEYQFVGSNGKHCETLEEFASLVGKFWAPCCKGGQQEVLERVSSKLKERGIKVTRACEVEVSFLVPFSGELREVVVLRGCNEAVDAAVKEAFEKMIWESASYEMKDGSMTMPFQCRCVLKVQLPKD